LGDFVESTGSKWTVMYYPKTAPFFTEDNNRQLYNFAPGSFRVTGYANTFSGASISSTNRNSTLLPAQIQISPGVFVTPAPAERVFLADATLSQIGQNVTAQKSSYNYTSIAGGYLKPHLSPHLNGRLPAGGNLAMLDGHVEWRDFDQMLSRVENFSSPAFWW